MFSTISNGYASHIRRKEYVPIISACVSIKAKYYLKDFWEIFRFPFLKALYLLLQLLNL